METRQSSHIGDIFRGISPSTPQIGDSIELGEGTLFVSASPEGQWVGLEPDELRNSDWLDPEALYRVHDQTVVLSFVS